MKLRRLIVVLATITLTSGMLASPAWAATSERCTQVAVGVGGLDTLKTCVDWGDSAGGPVAWAYASYYTSCGRAGHNVAVDVIFNGPFGQDGPGLVTQVYVPPCSVKTNSTSNHTNPSGLQAWAATGTEGVSGGSNRAPASGYYAF